MRIGIDLDGCVYDFVEALRRWIHNDTGRRIDTMGPPTCWEFFWQDWSMPFAEFKAHCDRGVDAGFIFAVGEPLPDSIETMRKLKADGHSLHIVTDRTFGTRSVTNTCEWLCVEEVPFDSLTFSADKTVAHTAAFIDDRPKNVEELRLAGCKGWLLDCNRRDQAQHPHRIADWATFYKLVSEMENAQ